MHTEPRGLPASESRILARILAPLLALLVIAMGLLVPAPAAHAAEVPGAITSVTTDKSSYGYNERIKLQFTWAVPDTASAGDSFTLDLPEELKAVSQAKFSLPAPDGSIVANAVWSGKSIVITLTDYADTHDGVGGSGFVTVQWDHSTVPESSQPITLEFGANAVEVVIGDKPTPTPPCTQNCPEPAPTPTTRGLSKSGGWADGSFEGTRDETGNINWRISLPGSDTGFAGPIDIVDTPAAGSIVECSTIAITSQLTLVGSAEKTAVDPSRYSLACAPAGFTVQLDRIAPTEFISISYKGTIVDQRSGVYGNHVAMTVPGTTTEKDVTIKRTDAGGIGDGVQSVSVGDYVWLDADNDGRQGSDEKGIEAVTLVLTGQDGKPVTDITGKPVGPTTTDSTGHYGFAKLPLLPAGQHYTVAIDAEASAEALDGLKPTAHGTGDRAGDSSTNSAESSDLTTNGAADLTLDFGFVLPELPTLPLPEPETDDTTEVEPAELETLALASTGTEAAPAIAGGAALLALGLMGLLAARRRRA